jgi:hypothetical protein
MNRFAKAANGMSKQGIDMCIIQAEVAAKSR